MLVRLFFERVDSSIPSKEERLARSPKRLYDYSAKKCQVTKPSHSQRKPLGLIDLLNLDRMRVAQSQYKSQSVQNLSTWWLPAPLIKQISKAQRKESFYSLPLPSLKLLASPLSVTIKKRKQFDPNCPKKEIEIES